MSRKPTTPRKRPCLDCGVITTATRCKPCASKKEKARQAKRGDRYTNPEYRRRRAEMEQTVEIYGYRCWRCKRYRAPGTFQRIDWHCDHAPWGELRPTCATCNSGHRGGETHHTPHTTTYHQ